MPTARYRVTVGERIFDVLVRDTEGGYETTLTLALSTPSSPPLPQGEGRGEGSSEEIRHVTLHTSRAEHLMSALINGESVQALADLGAEGGTLVLRGVPFDITVQDERAARLAALTAGAGRATGAATLKAPMPGLVVRVNVAEGAQVAKGDPLVVLQAMKMENELAAPRAGTVKHVGVQAGQTVEHGQALVVLE